MKQKRVVVWLGCLLLVLLLVALLCMLLLPRLVEGIVEGVLRRRGLGDVVHLRVHRVGLGRAELGPVVIGGDAGGLRVGLVSFTYTPGGLWRKRLERVVLSGVEVESVRRDGEVTLSALDALREISAAFPVGNETEMAVKDAWIPRVVEVRDSMIRFVDDGVREQIPFSFSACVGREDVSGAAELLVAGAPLSLEFAVSRDSGRGVLDLRYTHAHPDRVAWHLAVLGLLPPSFPVSSGGLSVDLQGRFEAHELVSLGGTVALEQMRVSLGGDGALAARHLRLDIDSAAPFSASGVQFSGRVGSLDTGGISVVSMDVSGHVSAEDAVLTVAPAEFSGPGGLRLEAGGTIQVVLPGKGGGLSGGIVLDGRVSQVELPGASSGFCERFYCTLTAEGIPHDGDVLRGALARFSAGQGNGVAGMTLDTRLAFAGITVRAADGVWGVENADLQIACTWGEDSLHLGSFADDGVASIGGSRGPILRVEGLHWEGVKAAGLTAVLTGVSAGALSLSGGVGLSVPEAELSWEAEIPFGSLSGSRAEVRLSPVRLSSGDSWVRQFFDPGDAVAEALVSGHVRVEVSGGIPVSTAWVSLRDGTFRLAGSGFTVLGISGDVELASLVPLRSALRQEVVFERAILGDTEFTAGSIRFALDWPRMTVIERLRLGWVGGWLAAYGVPLTPGVADIEATVYAEHLELSRVLNAIRGIECTGEGRLYGFLPLSFRDGEFGFADGFLYSIPGETGSLRMSQLGMLESALGGGGDLKTVRRALRNFEYDLLRIDVNGSRSALSGIGLKLIGREAGGSRQPIHLDVNIRGALAEVLNLGLRVGGVGGS